MKLLISGLKPNVLSVARLGKEKEAMTCYDRALELAGDHEKTIALRESCVRGIKEAKGEGVREE